MKAWGGSCRGTRCCWAAAVVSHTVFSMRDTNTAQRQGTVTGAAQGRQCAVIEFQDGQRQQTAQRAHPRQDVLSAASSGEDPAA
jgi:hypothetical protein